MKEHSRSDSGAFGVANYAVEWTSLCHNALNVLDRSVGTPMRCREPFPHEFAHGVLWSFPVRKLADPRQHILVVRLLYVPVRLNEAIVRCAPKIVLEAFRRHCFAWTMGKVESGGPVIGEFLQNRCFILVRRDSTLL